MTNYEKIKSMSIEEMEKDCEHAFNLAGKSSCEYCIHLKYITCGEYVCERRIKQWLEQEVDE